MKLALTVQVFTVCELRAPRGPKEGKAVLEEKEGPAAPVRRSLLEIGVIAATGLQIPHPCKATAEQSGLLQRITGWRSSLVSRVVPCYCKNTPCRCCYTHNAHNAYCALGALCSHAIQDHTI